MGLDWKGKGRQVRAIKQRTFGMGGAGTCSYWGCGKLFHTHAMLISNNNYYQFQSICDIASSTFDPQSVVATTS